jgi:hypothetical protein
VVERFPISVDLVPSASSTRPSLSPSRPLTEFPVRLVDPAVAIVVDAVGALRLSSKNSSNP